ncbi:hypothetical protein HU826_12035 [Enterobacter cancerogenus]|uniref:hypothetical protein n=1 Tax=Enterobacter cancerogenus TaxID=69218 RepID=UPI001CA4536A|nr:hypothetical protein [Enterobacter cancerogenus]QZY35096.1 hypothetical protein HU826_12035 [Enterobacter cancerogenus]
MLRIAYCLMPFLLSGCISVYGPVKTGGDAQNTSQSDDAAGMAESASVVKIGNRKPDELINSVQLYYQQKGIPAVINDHTIGIVAAVGDDVELASLMLDCSEVKQTQNIQERYRVVTQVWSAGEGSNVSVSVTGTAGLVTPDGNDKVKPVECKSTGTFEKDLLERLRK